MPYVYSTLTADQEYTFYQPVPDLQKETATPRKAIRSILIKGGYRTVDKKTLVTNRNAVVTQVSKEELEALESHPSFKKHRDKGFVKTSEKIIKSEEKQLDKIERTDKSTPLTPEQLKAENEAKGEPDKPLPTTGKDVPV